MLCPFIIVANVKLHKLEIHHATTTRAFVNIWVFLRVSNLLDSRFTHYSEAKNHSVPISDFKVFQSYEFHNLWFTESNLVHKMCHMWFKLLLLGSDICRITKYESYLKSKALKFIRILLRLFPQTLVLLIIVQLASHNYSNFEVWTHCTD